MGLPAESQSDVKLVVNEEVRGSKDGHESTLAPSSRNGSSCGELEPKSSEQNALEKGPSQQNAPPSPPPDGGMVAWLQVLASFLLFFNNVGMVNSFGIFQSIYETTVIPDSTASQISWIGSLQPLLLTSIPLFTGPLFDKGYGRILLLAGSFLAVFGLFMTSLATQYWQLILSQGLCMGFGFGLQFIAGTAVVPAYFARRRAFAIGIGVGGSSIGAIIYPAVFRALEPRVGFGWATRVLAFIMLGTLSVACACLRVRVLPPVARKFWDSNAMRSPPFLCFSAGTLLGFLALFVPFFYCVLFATHVGTPESLSFYTASIMNVGSFIGRVAPAFAADKFGTFNTLVSATTASAVVLWCWTAVHGEAGFIVWALVYGFTSGTFASMQVACLATLVAKERDMRFVGTWMGMNFTFAAIGSFIGGPIAGAILNNYGSWVGLQSLVATSMTLAASCFVAALYKLTR